MTQSIKALFKRLLPYWIAQRVASARRSGRFSGMSTKDAFEKVYAEGFWGRDVEGNPISGTGSHDATVVAPYVAVTSQFLGEIGRPTVVDLGCGDFNIGRQLSSLCESYLACDISETILEINRRRHVLENVRFQQLDIATDNLPDADVCIVRQVLQHLSNAEIARFVDKLNQDKPYRHLIVTEHVAVDASVSFNLDKPSGPGVRVENRSGVDITRPPFSLDYLESRKLLEVRQDSRGIPAAIVTTVYALAQKRLPN